MHLLSLFSLTLLEHKKRPSYIHKVLGPLTAFYQYLLYKTVYRYIKTFCINRTPGNIFVRHLIFNIPQPSTFIVKLFDHIMISLFLSYVTSTRFITNYVTWTMCLYHIASKVLPDYSLLKSYVYYNILISLLSFK